MTPAAIFLPRDWSQHPAAVTDAPLVRGVGGGPLHRVCLLDEGLVELLVLERARSSASSFPADLVRKLTHAGISLLEGRIVRHEGWIAELVLDPGVNVCGDYASLLCSAPPRQCAWQDPRLIDYQLSMMGTSRELLQLEVHAWDGLGLLASVMARVVSCGFQIEELLLETEGECAFHRLILAGDANAARAARLDRKLSGICA